MLTTQEMLNNVFTSGAITTETILDVTNSLIDYTKESIDEWTDEMIELVYNAGTALIKQIEIDPEKAKTLITTATEKVTADRSMDDETLKTMYDIAGFLVHEIDKNPQLAKESIGAIIVALDMWYAKLSDSK